MIYNAQGDIYQKKKKKERSKVDSMWEWSFMNAFLSE